MLKSFCLQFVAVLEILSVSVLMLIVSLTDPLPLSSLSVHGSAGPGDGP